MSTTISLQLEAAMPGIFAMAPGSMPAMPSIPVMLTPISVIASCGRGSRAGTCAMSPLRGDSVPRAKPERSIDWAKIVYAPSALGLTMTSSTSPDAIRNSSTVTGSMSWPSAATTVRSSPGMRTSKILMAEPLMKRSRTLSPGLNRAVQLPAGVVPFIR